MRRVPAWALWVLTGVLATALAFAVVTGGEWAVGLAALTLWSAVAAARKSGLDHPRQVEEP